MSDLHPHHEDHPQMISRVARRGLILFLVYFVLYAGFLLLNVFSPGAIADSVVPLQPVPPGRDPRDVMHLDFHGINLALVYGLGLIITAMFLALYYMHLTQPPRKK